MATFQYRWPASFPAAVIISIIEGASLAPSPRGCVISGWPEHIREREGGDLDFYHLQGEAVLAPKDSLIPDLFLFFIPTLIHRGQKLPYSIYLSLCALITNKRVSSVFIFLYIYLLAFAKIPLFAYISVPLY